MKWSAAKMALIDWADSPYNNSKYCKLYFKINVLDWLTHYSATPIATYYTVTRPGILCILWVMLFVRDFTICIHICINTVKNKETIVWILLDIVGWVSHLDIMNLELHNKPAIAVEKMVKEYCGAKQWINITEPNDS